MHKRCLALALLSVVSLEASAAGFNPYEGPQPLAVLIQTDPWAMVLGADTPRIVVYENGTAIFIRESRNGASLRRKDLSPAQLADFKKRLVPITQLKGLKPFYNLLPNVSDQPQALFYLREADRELATGVYGLRAASTKLPGYTVSPKKKEPEVVPAELLELHAYLCTLSYPDSQPWVPQYLELIIWPYEYAPDASIVWPKTWPGLDSERAVRHGNSYSIYLDASILPELRRFLKTRKEKGAVEIGGLKWAASYREVFPSEPVWRKPLRGVRQKDLE